MTTTVRDVTIDVVSALEMYSGLCGSEDTTIERVDHVGSEKDVIELRLSNGDVYSLRVRFERTDEPVRNPSSIDPRD